VFNEKIIEENLIQTLAPWQRLFVKTKTFEQLKNQLIAFLKERENLDPAKEAFFHAYEVFLHMCETDPEGIKEKEKFRLAEEMDDRNQATLIKYNKYLESIKNEKI